MRKHNEEIKVNATFSVSAIRAAMHNLAMFAYDDCYKLNLRREAAAFYDEFSAALNEPYDEKNGLPTLSAWMEKEYGKRSR